MQEMCKILTPYKCKNCGQDMLFFETGNNTLIDYKSLFFNKMTLPEIKKYLEIKNIKFIKCLSCNKSYIIDWTEMFPVQLMDKQAITKFRV